MNETPIEDQFKEIASQLSCPTGDGGLRTAENMALHNSNMIITAIDALDLQAGDAVLEIGPGSGTHLDKLFEKAANLTYSGVDISELMVTEAAKNNAALVESGAARFCHSNGEHLDFESAAFDKIFTVNTLYFWVDPVAYARELWRVLKPGGVFCLCFAPKEFMSKLPFTRYIFKLYTLEEAEALLTSAGFTIINSKQHKEVVKALSGESIDRDFIVLSCTKKLN